MSGGVLSRKTVITTTAPIDVVVNPNNVNIYSESLAVAGFATTTILSYTVPALKKFKLQAISYSGDNRSVYQVELNTSVIAKQRLYFTEYNGSFDFFGLELAAGDIIQLIVENKANSVSDFNGNLIGRVDNA